MVKNYRDPQKFVMWTRSVSWSFEKVSFPKEALYRLFILLNFLYCSQVWHHYGTKNTSKLKKVNELVLRFFFRRRGGKESLLSALAGHISPWRDICPVCFFFSVKWLLQYDAQRNSPRGFNFIKWQRTLQWSLYFGPVKANHLLILLEVTSHRWVLKPLVRRINPPLTYFEIV